jgi:LacI family transcriptional regulator
MELGYQPDEVARSLRGKRSRTIGLIVADSSNPFYAECAKAIEEISRAHGYMVILCASDESEDIENEYVELLSRRRVDGLLIVPAGKRGEISHPQDRYKGIVTVALDRPVENVLASAVLVENLSGMLRATTHLIQHHKHQTIAFVGGYEDVYTVRKRLEGYQEAVQTAGLEDIHRFGAVDVSSAAIVTDELLRLPEPPSAILAWNNLALIGILKALSNHEVKIPDEVAVIGFDDFELAALLYPRLTVVRQPTADLAREAAKLLFNLLDDSGEIEPQRIVLPTELVVRDSCGCR